MAKAARPKLIRIKTRDGWRLAIYRYAARFRTSRWGPVVLCHGLGANRFNMDAPDEEISLARYLAGRSHDTWVVELRGAGRSRPPAWPLQTRRAWDFDDYVQKDVPAILRRVLDDTGATNLNWVGHSMGGMLAYAAMIQYDTKLFRSVVTMASPVFTRVAHPLLNQVYRLRGLLKVVPWLPYRPVGMLGALAPKLTSRGLGLLFANPDQMDPKHVRKLAPRVLTNLPSTLIDQFAEWYNSSEGFARTDGLMSYWEHLDRVGAPLLVIAGAGDQLSPVRDLEQLYESVGSKKKKLLVCGRATGFSVDYGHIDLVLGKSARKEVYPHVADWIETH
ncbi:MAG: alpha/beta fold hydrolase [Myxococcales bacterium]|nr:alpha/beta fold hydrolase [Myxococcales bacterium]